MIIKAEIINERNQNAQLMILLQITQALQLFTKIIKTEIMYKRNENSHLVLFYKSHTQVTTIFKII